MGIVGVLDEPLANLGRVAGGPVAGQQAGNGLPAVLSGGVWWRGMVCHCPQDTAWKKHPIPRGSGNGSSGTRGGPVSEAPVQQHTP